MGFAEDMQAILGQCRTRSGECLFSATCRRGCAKSRRRTSRQPAIVDLVGAKDIEASSMSPPGNRRARAISQRVAAINDVIAMYASSAGRVIVFCDTKAECDALASPRSSRWRPRCSTTTSAGGTRGGCGLQRGRFSVLVAADVGARPRHDRRLVIGQAPVKRMSSREDTETYVPIGAHQARWAQGVCVRFVGQRPASAGDRRVATRSVAGAPADPAAPL